MEDIKTGGPAFPFGVKHTWDNYRGESSTLEENEEGMTLRDYFAAQALPSCISAAVSTSLTQAQVAALAYEFAYAMLAAREGGAK